MRFVYLGMGISCGLIWKYSVLIFPSIITEKFWSKIFNMIEIKKNKISNMIKKFTVIGQ